MADLKLWEEKMHNIIRIDANTWRIENEGVRIFLLEGDEKALLIDTGRTLPNAREIAASLTEKPVELLNTHADPDHTSGNGAFDFFYMSPSEEYNCRPECGKGKLIPVSEGDVIDLGNRELRIIDIPGHTFGSIAVLDVQKKALISGDPIQDGNIYMFSDRRSMTKYVESLDHLTEDYAGQFDVIYPSHGSFPVYPELVPELKEAALKILSGRAEGRPMTLHGSDILLYEFPFAGFYCDRRK